MNKLIICTICPNSCELEVSESMNSGAYAVKGNRCEKGEEYAINEYVNPRRTFTGNVKAVNSWRKRVPVRSTEAMPKNMLIPCAKELDKIIVSPPVNSGEVIVRNVLGLDVDIVATMSIKEAD